MLLDPHVGGEIGGVRSPEIDRRPAEQLLILGDVTGPELLVRGPLGVLEVPPGDRLVIAGDVGVVDVAGADRDQQRDAVCGGDRELPAGARDLASLGERSCEHEEPHRAGDAPVVAGDAVERHGRLIRARAARLLRTVEAPRERDRAGRLRGEPHRDHLVGGARDDLAPARHSTGDVAERRRRGLEVELAPVVRATTRLRERELQVADRLVGELARRVPEHRLVGEALGLTPLVVEHELLDLAQRPGALGVRVVVRPAGPDGVLVELQGLVLDVAVHHRAEPAVADRQGAQPVAAGRLVVPQPQISGPRIAQPLGGGRSARPRRRPDQCPGCGGAGLECLPPTQLQRFRSRSPSITFPPALEPSPSAG